ncbi:MAG TPA: dihydrolipoyllysine-residue acetyltransferase [Solirubrobacteraceae bacterium]|nr:dihydrolipoyllysine-residue acetyltransferase [Solirubrobacteraceae bacterium]
MSAATSSVKAVEVPDIGDFDDVPVIEILVSVGDEVAVEDPLVTLESDKATMDVPAPVAGTVKEVAVKLGDRVSQGSALLTLEPAAQQEPPPAAAPARPQSAPSPPASLAPASALAPVHPAQARTNGAGPVYASPAVRRLARELGVDLSSLSGSGRKGRIVADDVRGAGAATDGVGVAARAGVSGLDLAPWPVVDFERFGETERVPRTRIQRISAPNLARNWVMIPHVTHNDEADITELEAWRKQLNAEHARDGIKVTMVSFMIAASVATLKAFPDFNAALDGDDLVLRRYYNIGFAADTPQGLVVPVIKNADRKGILELASELSELSGRAREGKLKLDDINGGTFSISSLGGIGGTSFTPIINAPEVAILGVTRAAVKPVWDEPGESFVPRLIVPLSLSYDHRVIDGASAARFVVHLARVLSDLRRALL